MPGMVVVHSGIVVVPKSLPINGGFYSASTVHYDWDNPISIYRESTSPQWRQPNVSTFLSKDNKVYDPTNSARIILLVAAGHF